MIPETDDKEWEKIGKYGKGCENALLECCNFVGDKAGEPWAGDL